MVELTGAWDAAGVADFLSETTVPMRLACTTTRDHPWVVALWYAYDDGTLQCATGRDADLVEFLDHDPQVGFEVSVNDPPYRGVRGYGEVTLEPDPEKELLRSLFGRYLGGTDNRLADRLLSPDREEVRVAIDPERLHSWDFTGRMPGRDE